MAITVAPRGLHEAGNDLSARLKHVYGVRLLVGEQSATPLVFFATFIGFALRAYFVYSGHGLPLNDGGLFYSMVQDIRGADYALPKFTSYNGGDIPFAYPPLTFYLATIIADVFRLSVLDILRILPLTASVATIPSFYLLAGRILRDKQSAVLATFIFALAPFSYNWEIDGGGLTRSFGYLFAVLAIYNLYGLTHEPTRGRAAVCTLFAAAAALSHMEMAVFVAISYAVILAFYGRNRTAFAWASVVTVGALALVTPWIVAVVSMHGPGPFLAALHTGGHSPFTFLRVLSFDYTGEPLFPLIASLGLLGLLVCLARRQYFLPIWVGVALFVDPRRAANEATVPMAMLGAIATYDLLLPYLEGLADSAGLVANRLRFRFTSLLPIGLVLYLFYAAPFADIDSYILDAMPRSDAEAMQWVSSNTPTDSSFLVLATPFDRGWAVDSVSEWFPALSERKSPSTVQGKEWLAGDLGMWAAMGRYNELKLCNDLPVECLDEWAEAAGVTFTHVYIGKLDLDKFDKRYLSAENRDCCAALRASLAISPGYSLVYDGKTSQVFERRGKTAEASPK